MVYLTSLNPFEVREVLQAVWSWYEPKRASQSLWSQGGAASSTNVDYLGRWSSQSLWSQGGAASGTKPVLTLHVTSQSLWSQGGAASWTVLTCAVLTCLNPFEVREVLQVRPKRFRHLHGCLNPFEVREVLQVLHQCHQWCWWVSIPLKSGRCCKLRTKSTL